MSFEFSSSKPLKIYTLNKKSSQTALKKEQLEQLKGHKNEEQNEFIYFLHKDKKNSETKWFINEQEFQLMKLISKLENNIKETDEQLMNCKSNLNKMNLCNVYALQMDQVFWIKKGDQSETLIKNYLDDKFKKDRNLEKKLSNLIEKNINILVILKDLMNSRLQPNFKETIIKIEENFN